MMTCGPFNSANCDMAKTELKQAYRSQNGLTGCTGPLMCFIGRLDAQKGYDLLWESLVEVLEDTEIQVVVVGAGRADLVAQTKALARSFSDHLRAEIRPRRTRFVSAWTDTSSCDDLKVWISEAAKASAQIRVEASWMPDFQPRST